MKKYLLPDIWQVDDAGLYHWFPDDPFMPRCGRFDHYGAERKTHHELNTGIVCSKCFMFFANAILRGGEADDGS